MQGHRETRIYGQFFELVSFLKQQLVLLQKFVLS